jgi:UDP-glucose 4-epimerase
LGNGTSHALNLGSGFGTSVKELLEAVQNLLVEASAFNTGHAAKTTVAGNSLANQTIGWCMTCSIIDPAWNWHSNYLPA